MAFYDIVLNLLYSKSLPTTLGVTYLSNLIATVDRVGVGLEVDGLLRCLAFSFLCSCILMTVLKGLIMPISDGDCYFEKNLNRSSLFWAFVNSLTLGMLFLCEDLWDLNWLLGLVFWLE